MRASRNRALIQDLILPGLMLSRLERRALTSSWFIPMNGTRSALEDLISAAKPTDELLAICGQKGRYADGYYKSNFARFRRVSRVFQFDAIRDEIVRKHTRFGLDGFLLHRVRRNDTLVTTTKKCQVNCSLVRPDKGIRNVYTGFNPPLSLGMAIVRSQRGKIRKAVLHWEAAVEAYSGLLNIEGLIIDGKQPSLLQKLVDIHEGLSSADMVTRCETEEQELTVGLVRLCEEFSPETD